LQQLYRLGLVFRLRRFNRVGLFYCLGLVDRMGFVHSLGLERLGQSFVNGLGISDWLKLDGVGLCYIDSLGQFHRLGIFYGLGLERPVLDRVGLVHRLG